MAGNRALHLAASRGHHDVCRVLIESGAEIGATNGKNLNAINEAQAAQHYNLSDYLRQQMGQRMQPSSTNQMQAGPNMPSRNMGGSNTNGLSSLNIGTNDFFPKKFYRSRLKKRLTLRFLYLMVMIYKRS